MRAAFLMVIVAMSGACKGVPDLSHAPPVDRQTVAASMAADMVRIPPGRFVMGSDAGIAEDEHPAHEVVVPAFAISRHEVTFEQYAAFAAATARPVSPVAQAPGHPATNVSWDDAQAFISWLNDEGGTRYRLPSEAEWEYAARAGSRSTYPWGDVFDAARVSGSGSQDGWAETSPVGSFPANAHGLHDMLGNVWEWAADCYHADYTGASGDATPRSGPEGCGRVLRGGSWSDTALWLRLGTRNWFDRSERFDYVGFRLAHD